jgi:hypothetical protein
MPAERTRRRAARQKTPSGKAGEYVREEIEKKAVKATSRKPSPTRSRAVLGALKREGRSAAYLQALSEHAKASARQRGPAARQSSAQKAVKTKGAAGR